MRTDILNPDDKHSLVYTTNLIVMLLSMLGVLFRWFAIGAENPPLPGIGIVLLLVANSVYLNKGGSAHSGGVILVLVMGIGLFFSGVNSGGFDGPILILAPVIPLFATLLLSPRGGMIAAVVTSVIMVAVFSLHMLGRVPENANGETGVLVGRFLAGLFTALVTTWVVWAFAQSHRRLINRIELMAHTDHLTGVANRRSVAMSLTSETARVRRSGGWLSTLMIDVDHFKRFNDLNGHAEGDQCLIRVAEVLKQAARRPADFVGRYGGEEFILVLPETDKEGAEQIAESIRASMQAENIPYQNGESDDVVTVSIGAFTSSGTDVESEEAMVRSADAALYEAKESGRNRVVARSVGAIC